MSNISNTVDGLVDQVRSQLDENNNSSVDTERDILPAINRAQDYAMNILARHYEEPLLDNFELDLKTGVQEYRIPENAFEDRVEKVEIRIQNAHFEEVKRISYRDITLYETSLRSQIPKYYVQLGKRIRFVPNPTGIFNARVWYLKCPPTLVLSQGQITHVNEEGNYLLVDSIGDDLTTETDNLNSYVNIIDGGTAEIKATLQIKRLDDNKVTFKTIPAREKVLNREIDTDISSLVDFDGKAPLKIEPDDYICSIQGSCVPLFVNPVSNFLIQFAVAELTRKLGGSSDMEERVKKQFEDQVERSWVGRESTIRIKKRARFWNRAYRRFLYSKGTFD